MSLGILGADAIPQPVLISSDNASQIRTRALVAGVVMGALAASLYFVIRYHGAFAPPTFARNSSKRK